MYSINLKHHKIEKTIVTSIVIDKSKNIFKNSTTSRFFF